MQFILWHFGVGDSVGDWVGDAVGDWVGAFVITQLAGRPGVPPNPVYPASHAQPYIIFASHTFVYA